METVAPACPSCVSNNVKKAGFSRFGKQRYKCRNCTRSFCLDPNGQNADPQRKAQILAACQERMSQRGIARVFGVSRNTVTKWLKKSSSVVFAQEDAGQGQEAGRAGT